MRAVSFSSSEDEEEQRPVPPRAAGRLPQERLQRVLSSSPSKEAKANKWASALAAPAEPPRELVPRPQTNHVALHSRVETVQRMSQALKARHGAPAAERFSFQQRTHQRVALPASVADCASAQAVLAAAHSAKAAAVLGDAASPHSAADDELAMSCGLGVTEHMQSILDEAAPGTDTSPELGAALEAALETAMQSLATCQSQQSSLLQREVVRLKAEFRERLAELEADFVARAEALSGELSSSVAERKGQCEDHVTQHARALTESIRVLRRGDPRKKRGGGGVGGGAPGACGGGSSAWTRGGMDFVDDDDEHEEIRTRQPRGLNLPSRTGLSQGARVR